MRREHRPLVRDTASAFDWRCCTGGGHLSPTVKAWNPMDTRVVAFLLSSPTLLPAVPLRSAGNY
jgi:hypothetical protein